MTKEQFLEFQEKYKFERLMDGGTPSVVFNSVQVLGPWRTGLYIESDANCVGYYLKFRTPSGMSIKAPTALKKLVAKYGVLSVLLIDADDPFNSCSIDMDGAGRVMGQFLTDFLEYLRAIEKDQDEIIRDLWKVYEDSDYCDSLVISLCKRAPNSPLCRPIEEIKTTAGNIYKTGMTLEILGDGTRRISAVGVTKDDPDYIKLTCDRWDEYSVVENYKDFCIDVTGRNNDAVLDVVAEFLDSVRYFLDEDDDNINGQSHQLHEVMNEISDIFGEEREYYTEYN